MSDLPIHVEEEYKVEVDYDPSLVEDILEDDKLLQEEINDRLHQYKTSLESLEILEDYHSSIYNKETISKEDISNLNLITKAIYNNLDYDYNGFEEVYVSNEALVDTLKQTASKAKDTFNKVKELGSNSIDKLKQGFDKTTTLAEDISKAINDTIVFLGGNFDTIIKLMEKRLFGFKRLVDAYDLQVAKLEDQFTIVTANSETPRANIKVKLNIARLPNERQVKDKNSFFKVVTEDVSDFSSFINSYIDKVQLIKTSYIETLKSLAFIYPYKHTLIKNLNVINFDMLKALSENSLFKDSDYTTNHIKSRVLIGGYQVRVGFNQEKLNIEALHKEIREAIKVLDISSIKLKKHSNDKDVEYLELNDFDINDCNRIIEILKQANSILRKYIDAGIPKVIRDREFFSRLTKTITGLASGISSFNIVKDFLSKNENIESIRFNIPARLKNSFELLVKTTTLSAIIGTIGAKTLGLLIDWIRKFIIAQMFTAMDMQYRLTKIMNTVDSSVIDAFIGVKNQAYRVGNSLSKPKVWT